MRFLFVYPSPGILGGIETLLARMSRWLVENGHEVTLLVESPARWTDLLPKEARCIALGEQFRELYYYFHAGRLCRHHKIGRPDVIKSFCIPSTWIACQIAAWAGSGCKVLAGVYNPAVFKWYYAPESLPRWSAARLYLRHYLECIPDNARVFCGTDQIEELAEVHQQKGILWPTPIDTSRFSPAVRRPKWGRLVSVGRLAPMKEYNLRMIDAVKELRARGLDVTWTVYGEGKYEQAMRARIKELGLESVIELKGTVPYHQFWQVLEEAYVFVGMGTALLEAALLKVPNLFAVPYDGEGMTFGPSYCLPSGSNGHGRSVRPLPLISQLERILRLGPAEYRAEEDKVYQNVRVHQMDASMRRLLELAREAAPVKQKRSLYLANYLLWLMRRGAGRRDPVVMRHPSAPNSTRAIGSSPAA